MFECQCWFSLIKVGKTKLLLDYQNMVFACQFCWHLIFDFYEHSLHGGCSNNKKKRAFLLLTCKWKRKFVFFRSFKSMSSTFKQQNTIKTAQKSMTIFTLILIIAAIVLINTNYNSNYRKSFIIGKS